MQANWTGYQRILTTSAGKWIFAVLVSLCLFFCSQAALADSVEDAPAFDWCSQTWVLRSATLNPPQVVDNPSPDTQEYLFLRLECTTGEVAIHDILENMGSFSLRDEAGENYPAAAYMPYSIAYNDRNGVFMTSMTQTIFDLFFIVPKDTPLESLSLQVDGANCPLCEAEIITQ